jgi:hypothetical protein
MLGVVLLVFTYDLQEIIYVLDNKLLHYIMKERLRVLLIFGLMR